MPPCVMFAPMCDFCLASYHDLEESIGFAKFGDIVKSCCAECMMANASGADDFSLMTCDMIVYYSNKKTTDGRVVEIAYHTESGRIVKTLVK